MSNQMLAALAAALIFGAGMLTASTITLFLHNPPPLTEHYFVAPSAPAAVLNYVEV